MPGRIASFFRNLIRKRAVEKALDDELESALELLIEEKLKQGVSHPEARRQALIELGGIEQIKQEVRAIRFGIFLETFAQDLRFAFRMLRKSPGFTALAVFTLALGIGANTAIFGLVDSAFLRGLPFREPERLVHIWTIENDDTHTPTPAQYQAVRDQNKSFQQVGAQGWADFFYSGADTLTESLSGSLVTPNWFATLGVQPFLGRNFREEEEQTGQDGVVMLSYDFWQTRFHADPGVIGQQIVLNRRPFTVVGILPRPTSKYDPRVFVPLVLNSYASQGHDVAGKIRAQIVARLKPGVTLDQARAEVEVIGEQFKNSSVMADRSQRLIVEDFAEMARHPGPTVVNGRRGLRLTALAAGAVLLIACANVASLLLARGVKRHREIAVRTALGSSRGRMIRQLLTESTLLFLFGGVVALIVTRWSEYIITKVASDMDTGAYLQTDARVLIVGMAVSLLAALAFGMIPALYASHVSLNESLKDTTVNVVGGSRSRRLRNGLVGGQVALGMVLLVGFGLLLRSYLNVENSRVGYDPRNILTVTTRLPFTRYTSPIERARLMHDVAQHVRLMAGVESAGIADSLPMDGADSAQLRIEAPAPQASSVQDEIWFVSVGPGYFSTLHIPMLSGRQFDERDGQTSGPVAVVNETFVKRYFPGTNALGRHLSFADSPTVESEIVGVVADFRQRNPDEDLRPLAYFSIAQTAPPRWSLVIRLRSASELTNVAAHINNWLEPIDPQLSWELGNLKDRIHDSESMTLRRPIITLLASFGSLALILVIVGVFGVTSYSVAERTREIGIRTALGAGHLGIARLVLRESLLVACAGLVAGTFGALAVARSLPAEGIGWSGSGIFLYGVSRIDSLTYGLAIILLIGVVLAASWWPTRRAMRVDPLIALRHE